MQVDITWLSAFVAGALSFLSPCVLPLVPPYLCYMAGISVDEFRSEGEKRTWAARSALIIASAAFVLGFTTIFIILGATATTVGQFVAQWREQLSIVAGVIIIIMGLNFLGIFRLGFLSREARFQTRRTPIGPFGAYIIGLAFAFGWTPCMGPILTPIIGMAASKAYMSEGITLLAVYSLGLGLPFLLAAIFSGLFMEFLTRFRTHMGMVEKIMGIFLIIAGLVFVTGQVSVISGWFSSVFPFLADWG